MAAGFGEKASLAGMVSGTRVSVKINYSFHMNTAFGGMFIPTVYEMWLFQGEAGPRGLPGSPGQQVIIFLQAKIKRLLLIFIKLDV